MSSIVPVSSNSLSNFGVNNDVTKSTTAQISSSAIPPSTSSATSDLPEKALISISSAKKKKKAAKDVVNANPFYFQEDGKALEPRILRNDPFCMYVPIISFNQFLKASEMELFKVLFEQCHPESAYNLFDLFLVDFVNLWNEILEKTNTNDKSFWINYRQDFFSHLFMMHIHFIGKTWMSPDFIKQKLKAGEISGTSENALTHPDFFHTPKSYGTWLSQFKEGLNTMSGAINYKKDTRMDGKSKKTQKFIQDKSAPHLGLIELLQTKIDLLAKYVNSPIPDQLLGFQSEFRIRLKRENIDVTPAENKLENIVAFSTFLKDLMDFGPKKGIISMSLINYFIPFHEVVVEISNKGVSKKRTDQFISAFKEFSYELMGFRGTCEIDYHKALNDPTFTHERYCLEKGAQRLHNRDRAAFLDSLLHRIQSAILIVKWVNNLSENLNHCFSISLNADIFKPPETYIHRFLTNLKSLAKSEKIEPRKYEDQFLNKFSVEIQQYVTSSYKQMEQGLTLLPKGYDLPTIIGLLEIQFNSHNFYYSVCQNLLGAFNTQRPAVDRILVQIQTVHKVFIGSIRKAHENGLLKDCEPEDLKKRLMEMITENMVGLCRYIMVIQDSLPFRKGVNHDDVIHLLPSPIISFLILDGFDEIFNPIMIEEPIKTVILAESVEDLDEKQVVQAKITATQPQPKKPVSIEIPIKKRVEAPTRRDFAEETKRNAIIRMLEYMGFDYKRSGKGSHEIYHNPETGKSTTVPQSVEKTGTRLAIFEQATDYKKKEPPQ